jgi:hypothetical protein
MTSQKIKRYFQTHWLSLVIALFLTLPQPSCRRDKIPDYEKIQLSRFPISLDVLFRTSQAQDRTQILNGIRVGRPDGAYLFMVPYPFYNHYNHFPGTLKWYLNTGAHTAISLPVQSFLSVRDDAGKPSEVIDGVACLNELAASLYLSHYIRIDLGHVSITQSLVAQFHQAPADVFGQELQAVAIPADTVFGFTSQAGVDFIMEDSTNSNFGPTGKSFYTAVNPFFYFTPAVQDQLRSYYQEQLDAMKQSGLYPESRLDRTFDINESQTFFGTWFYKEGWLQPGANNHPYGWYSFDGCIINIWNVEKTDRDTFFRDANTGLPFGSVMLGVYCDASYDGSIPDYDVIGGKYMVRSSGTSREGVVRLDNFFGNVRPGPIYMKYLLEERDPATMYDDLLQVEYFPSAAAAAGPFSANKLTYIRIFERI